VKSAVPTALLAGEVGEILGGWGAADPAPLPGPAATSAALQLPPPGPLVDPARSRAQEGMVQGLIRALIADRTTRAIAEVFGVYSVPCLEIPRHEYTVELTPLAGGLRAACTCDETQALELMTPELLLAACWHVQLVLWFLSPAPLRARWGRVYPHLAAAWADFCARRRRELAVAWAPDLVYQAIQQQ